jgi:hypothetical protein
MMMMIENMNNGGVMNNIHVVMNNEVGPPVSKKEIKLLDKINKQVVKQQAREDKKEAIEYAKRERKIVKQLREDEKQAREDEKQAREDEKQAREDEKQVAKQAREYEKQYYEDMKQIAKRERKIVKQLREDEKQVAKQVREYKKQECEIQKEQEKQEKDRKKQEAVTIQNAQLLQIDFYSNLPKECLLMMIENKMITSLTAMHIIGNILQKENPDGFRCKQVINKYREIFGEYNIWTREMIKEDYHHDGSILSFMYELSPSSLQYWFKYGLKRSPEIIDVTYGCFINSALSIKNAEYNWLTTTCDTKRRGEKWRYVPLLKNGGWEESYGVLPTLEQLQQASVNRIIGKRM